MRITKKQLRRIIRESFLSPLTKEKYAYNKNLTRVYQELVEEAIPFGNDKVVDAALSDVKVAFDKLKKAIFNSQQAPPLKEHVTDEHHEHPHVESHRQVPHIANKSEAEDLLHDTLLHVEGYLSLEEIEAIFAQLY